MTKDQEDTLNMYQSTDEVLQNHNSDWTANVPFSDAVDDLEGHIETIEGLRDKQQEDISGVADDKQAKRNILEEQTYTAASILVFFASVNNNRKLLKKVNFTKTQLSKARDNELPGMSKQVHDEAVTNAAGALPFGLTGTMTTNLGTALDNYTNDISKPRTAKTETSAATEQLPGVFTQTDTILTERLDKGMELFRISNPGFYTEYFNARILVNSPTLKRALEVHFEDAATAAALAHVDVTIDAGIKRRSSKLGNIRQQNLAEGSHNLAASLPGYRSESAPFNVITGETTKITIRMTKI